MNAMVMIFMLALGAVLQAVLPAWAVLGLARVPVLLGLVLYYALTRPRAAALRAAVLAGLLQDGLGMIPLGYSSFCFSVMSIAVNHVKDEVFANQWGTHMLFGAAANAAVTLGLYLLLVHGGDLAMSGRGALLKIGGALLLGAVAAPLVFRGAAALERMLGFTTAQEVV